LSGVWDRIIGDQLDPAVALVVVTGLLAFVAVATDAVWWRARNVITIVHEAGHAATALATGRRLTGIRLHSDTSGLTLTVGRPEGAGMIATLAAGYLSPSLLGLVGVVVLASGLVTIALWVAVAALLAMLTLIRNAYGVLSVVLTGLVIGLVAWYAPASAQAAFGYAATWFLLIGGIRPIAELYRHRRRAPTAWTDADHLAYLTRAPALAWITLFALSTIAALAIGAWLLLT